MSRHAITATIFDRKGRVLSIGQNNYLKTHPLQAEHAAKVGEPYKIFLHAEISALVRIRGGKPYKIAIERYGRDGQPRMARPCAICELAIREAGITRVEYTVG